MLYNVIVQISNINFAFVLNMTVVNFAFVIKTGDKMLKKSK